MKILDGKRISQKILTKIRNEVKKRDLKLRLAVILIGENPVSQVFINQKKKASQKTGIDFKLFKFSKETEKQKLEIEIKKIIKNPKNSGIIIQLPLPKKFQPEEFLNLIPANKDVDVLSEKSLGKFFQGTLNILPPTVKGILYLLRDYKISPFGKNVVIIGAGRLVGLPLTLQLLREKATVTVLNEFTKDITFFTKKADILISGVGKPHLICDKMIKKGVVAIDAGTSMEKGKLVGDIDFQSVSKKASYITPVPGGLGPMTVACLLENLVKVSK